MPPIEILMIEAIGWLGAVLVIGAYTLLSIGKLDGRSRAFQWMNVLGALGIVINSAWNGAIPSAALNVVWMGIGLLTLIGVARSARSRNKPNS